MRYLTMTVVFLIVCGASAIAGGNGVAWRCWAARVMPKGERGCSSVFVADTRPRAARLALQLCEDGCGEPCKLSGCAPLKAGR